MSTEAWREWAKRSVTARNRKHLAIDLDDVLLDFTGGVRKEVEYQFGVEVPEFTDWKISKILTPIIGRGWWRWMQDNVEKWPTFDMVEGAVAALHTLRKAGYRLDIVTSKPEWGEWVVWAWMAEHQPPVHGVSITGKGENKSDFSQAYILIDDRPENVAEWTQSTDRRAILFDRSHNRGYTLPNSRISRAIGWSGVLDELKEIT